VKVFFKKRLHFTENSAMITLPFSGVFRKIREKWALLPAKVEKNFVLNPVLNREQIF